MAPPAQALSLFTRLSSVLFVVSIILPFGPMQTPCTSQVKKPAVRTGIEVLRSRAFDILQGKRVGLITNPTGVDASLRSTIDILHDDSLKVVALFGPEHGVRGDHAAGDIVGASTDSATGAPVYSLYGAARKPTPEMLRDVDVLVYDIQDIGCRSYTYISTMGLAMEAAGECGIPFVVLDRPNPLGGERMEGTLVADGFRSFVSQFPIPYVYGLTCGELAGLLNGEGLLESGRRCELIVVPMEGWKRSMIFEETGLPWVPTSPHVPHAWSPFYYVSTGVLGELGVISEGVGYTIPFQMFAAEWIDGVALADSMNALGLPGVLFRPISFTPFYGRDAGKPLHGAQVYILDPRASPLMALQFYFLQVHNGMYPEKNPFSLTHPARIRMFDRVAGTDEVRNAMAARMQATDALKRLDEGVGDFRRVAQKYFLY
jgi:uncharacterized protein YbbC (DUF1343 family)